MISVDTINNDINFFINNRLDKIKDSINIKNFISIFIKILL